MRTNNSLLNNFLLSKQSDGKSKNTIDGYEVDLIQFIKYRINDVYNGSITIDNVNIEFFKEIDFPYLNNYKNAMFNEGKAVRTRARNIMTLRQFFEFLYDMKYIEENPAEKLKAPTIPKREVVFLELEEAEKLMHNIDGEHKIRDNSIITMFLNSGLRLSELVSINIEDIKGNRLQVIGKGNKQRKVFLNESCLEALEQYLQIRNAIDTDDKALFLSERKQRISNRTVQYLVKKHLNASELDTEKYSAHRLRATAASMLSKGNVPVATIQGILGHANIQTTMKYVGVSDMDMQEGVNANPLNKRRRVND